MAVGKGCLSDQQCHRADGVRGGFLAPILGLTGGSHECYSHESSATHN